MDRHWFSPSLRKTPHGRLQILFLVTGLALLAYLLFGEKPWVIGFSELEKPQVDDFRVVGLWWGSAAALLFSVLGYLMARLGGQTDPPARTRTAWTRPHWILLLLALLLGSAIRIPRLGHSFWNDEEYAFRSYSYGKTVEGPLGEDRKFRSTSWEKALFLNNTGNNHLLHTIEARIGVGLYQVFGMWPEEEGYFRESAPRLFPFLSGLGTILAMGWLAALVAGPRAGVAAAFLVALSPWHLRYSVEARGYSTMLLLIILSFVFLVNAIRTNQWRWWIGLMAAQAGMLLAFQGSVPIAVATALLAPAAAWGKYRLVGVIRYLTAALAAAIPVVVLVGPSVPQILAYLAREDTHVPAPWGEWLRDLWCHVVAGIPWHSFHQEGAIGAGAADLLGGGYQWLLVLAAPFLLLGWFLIARQRIGLLALAVSLLGPIILFLQFYLGDSPAHGWYALPVLIPFWLGLSALAGSRKWSAMAVVGAYALLVAVPLFLLSTIPRHPIRETVAQAKEIAPTGVRAVFGMGDRQVLSYDPGVLILKTGEDLEKAEQLARESQRPLVLYSCGRRVSSERCPEIAAALLQAERYEEVTVVPGFEPSFTYTIWKSAP